MVNVAQSKASQRDAAQWDTFGSVLGSSVGVLLILVAAGVIAWLRFRAFQPVFALAAAMERFGRGERETRAPESGALELSEMSVRFNEMASTISAQREAQMAFLGGIAHDLRNPLSALKMSVALLGPDLPLPSEERVRQIIARIGRQIARMDRMAGDFLDVAKIEVGQLDLRFEIHDVRALVEEVVELFDDAASEHRIIVRLPDHGVFIRCDSLRIVQVITNLISNALKYSSAGTEVELELEVRGDQISLSVADHGLGISDEDKPRIFEPFRRVGLSRESVPGVGLGLFVVRRIVEAHCGRIDVESVPGMGSTFRIFLPADNQAERALVHQPGAPRRAAAPSR